MKFLVYKLIGDNGLIYYGSTQKNRLYHRMWAHRNQPDSTCSSKALEGKFTYEILENNIPHKHIALIREGYYIHNFPCINQVNPDKWYKEATPRQWWRENPEKNKLACKKFYATHKELYKNYYKKYNEDNKEKILACKKRYYKENRKKFLDYKAYRKSMGGDARYHNNLVEISPDLFK